MRLLDSPRRRPRLAWGGSIGLVVAAGVSAGIVFSNTGHSSATPFEDRPAEVFKLKDVPFSGKTAREAGRTISRFVHGAVHRHLPDLRPRARGRRTRARSRRAAARTGGA